MTPSEPAQRRLERRASTGYSLSARSLQTAGRVAVGLSCAASLGCASVDSGLGKVGGLSPLTGQARTHEIGPVVPVWRTTLSEPSVFQEVRHQLGGVAHDASSDQIAVLVADGTLHCLSASNGRELWRTDLGGGGGGHAYFRTERPPANGKPTDGPEKRIYLGTDDGRMMAVRASDGRKIWSYRVQGAITRGPVFDGDMLYFVDGENAIYALKRTTGEWVWQYRREAPAEFALVGESRPVVADGKVYVGFSDGVLVSLDAQDGAVIWQRDLAPEHDRFQDVDASAVVGKTHVYAASAAAGIYALEIATGEVAWNVPITGAVHMIGHDEDVIVGLDEGQLLRMRGVDGFVQWRTRFGRDSGAPGEPVLIGGDLLVGLSKGGMHALDAYSGRPINQFSPGNGIHAPLTVGADGRVFFLSDGAVIYGFSQFDAEQKSARSGR